MAPVEAHGGSATLARSSCAGPSASSARVAILVLPLALAQLAPVRAAMATSIGVMQGGSALGVAVYFATYAAGAVLTMPTWLLSGMAGYAYGPVRGVLLASPANVLGAMVTFLLGRWVIGGALGRRLPTSGRWGAIHRAVDADAFRIGFLLRISPFAPQNLLGYGLSLTPMRARTFVAATWLGLHPDHLLPRLRGLAGPRRGRPDRGQAAAARSVGLGGDGGGRARDGGGARRADAGRQAGAGAVRGVALAESTRARERALKGRRPAPLWGAGLLACFRPAARDQKSP